MTIRLHFLVNGLDKYVQTRVQEIFFRILLSGNGWQNTKWAILLHVFAWRIRFDDLNYWSPMVCHELDESFAASLVRELEIVFVEPVEFFSALLIQIRYSKNGDISLIGKEKSEIFKVLIVRWRVSCTVSICSAICSRKSAIKNVRKWSRIIIIIIISSVLTRWYPGKAVLNAS